MNKIRKLSLKPTPSRSTCKKTSVNLFYNVIKIITATVTSRMRVNKSKPKDKNVIKFNDR